MSTTDPTNDTTAPAAVPVASVRPRRSRKRHARLTILNFATGRYVPVPVWLYKAHPWGTVAEALELASLPGETGPEEPSLALVELLAEDAAQTYPPAAESAYQAPWQPTHPCHRVHALAPRAPSPAGRSAVAA